LSTESVLKDLYVQYGSWKDEADGWLSYDASPYLRIDRIPYVGTLICELLQADWTPFPHGVQFGNIVTGLPLPDESCKGIYCSHVLEHLSLSDFRKAITNTNRLLVAGGVFRLVLPDLMYYIRRYTESSGADAAPEFMRSTGLGEIVRNNGLKGLAKELLGNSKHRWMWDYASLELELVKAGFVHVRRATIGDSVDSRFSAVERLDRWENCLGIECTKFGT
jgi:hypothetical protein